MKKKCLISWGFICIMLMCVACGMQRREEQIPPMPFENVEETEGLITESVMDDMNDEGNMFLEKECVIQVQTDTQLGSGVLWDRQENFWSFVTAAHVVEDVKEADVYFALEDKILSASVFCVEGLDLAFLQIETEKINKQIEDVYKECDVEQGEIAVNQILTAKGYNPYGIKCEYLGEVLETWIYVEDFQNYMLLCECEAEPGMSGGGVFSEKAGLMGLICGENEEGVLAVLPVDIIESEYQLFVKY